MAQQILQFGLKINTDTSDARAELDRLKQVLGQLGTGSQFKLNAKQEIREASVAAQQLQKHLTAATSKTGDFDINRFTASIKKGEMSLSQMSMKLMQLGREGTDAFRTLSTQILNAQRPALSFSNILTKMGTTLANNIRWQLSSAAINAVTSSIREAWTYTKNMDKALTNIRVVTGKSREEMDKLAAASNRMAKELRSTTEEMVKGQLIFYQQGDNAALAAEKARITAMAANVSFESSQEEMADYLTAIWNSYQVGENQLELFVDKLSAVGASTATSMEEIATGMTKVASAANAVGVTYDQLNATIATISSTTRVSAESVGTAMKTIYARMGDLKVGKADEDGITYGQVSKQMKQMGIDIADANGQLRDMGEVVEEIGNKWKTFGKEEQQALVQAVAGKRQYTNLTALFENWDMYLNTLETSKNAMGTLQEQQDAWANSIEGASNRVTSSLEGLYSRILDDDVVISMTNGLASFLEYFTGLIDALGGLETILPAITGLMVSTFAPAIVSGLTSGMMNLRTLFGGWMIDLQKSRDGLIQMVNAPGFDRLSAEQQKLILNTRDLAIAQNEYVNNSRHMTAQQKQEAQFAMDTAQALQVTIAELEATAQAYKDAALASKNFSTAGGANVQNLNAGSATMAFQKAFSVVDSNQGFFSPALKQQLDDIQTKIQSGVKPSVDELRNAIIAYNNEVNNLNAGGAPANIDQLGKAFDKLMTKMSQAQAQMEGYRTLASNLKVNPGGGFTFDAKDITVANQIRQALKDVGVEASIIEQIMKDGVIPDGVLGPDIKDITNLETAANKAEKTLNRFARLGNKKFGLPVEELKKSAKVTRDHTLANEDYIASLERAKGQAKAFGTGLTTAIGGITSLTFSLSSLKSAGDAIASGDWLTGISSSLMGLTMAGSGVKSIADGIVAMHGEGGEAIIGLARSMNDMGLTFQKTGSLVTDTALSATTAWISVLGPILAVTAALAALGAAIYLVAKDFKQAETNMKSAKESAKTFAEDLSNAQNSFNTLKNDLNSYNEKQSALSKMTEGTKEFTDAVDEANNQVLDLMSKYPELAEYVDDANGQLAISIEGQKKLLEIQQKQIEQAKVSSLVSKNTAIQATQEYNEQQLADKILGTKATAIGSSVAAGLAGAATGAAIGSVIPIFGTAIGAIVGGLIGAAGGVATGYYSSGAGNKREHGLDKFTAAIESQGISILSSYNSLERALNGDSELARALWANKEETNNLAKEIVNNKKQVEINTKQLIANNSNVKNSLFSSDLINEGNLILQDKQRSQKYADEMIELLNGSEQDAADAYLKAMYGSEAHKYQIIDRFGTNSTLRKMNDEGVWEIVGTKSGLSDQVMIENYRNAKAATENLTQEEIAQITEKSAKLRAKILSDSKDEVTQAIIAQYGKDAKSAIEAIKKSGKGFIEIYRETLKGQFNNTSEAWQEMINFELQNNIAFEGLSQAIKNNDTEALEKYLKLFQELGFFIGEDTEIFKKFNIEAGKFNDEAYTEAALRKLEKIKEKGKTSEVEFSSGFMNLEGVTERRTENGGMEIVEGEEIVRNYLSSYFPPELIDQIMKEYLDGIDIGTLFDKYFTAGIEKEIEDVILNDPTAVYSLPTNTTDWENEYGVGIEKAKEYAQAIIDLREVQGSQIKVLEDGQIVLENNGKQYDQNSISALAWEASLNKTILSASNFKNISSEMYNSIVSVGTAYGWTKGQTNQFLTSLNSLNGASPDLSGFIDQCAIAGGAAMQALNNVLALHGVMINTTTDPETGQSVITVSDSEGNTKEYHPKKTTAIVATDKNTRVFKTTVEDSKAFTARVYKEIIAEKGISPKDIYTDFTSEWKEMFSGLTLTGPGITNPSGGGDKKSAQSKVYEATKKKYEDEIKQAEADLKAGVIDYAKYRKTVETAWSGLVTAFQGLNAEEQEAAKSEMQSTSLGVREVIVGYFDNIAEEWKEGYKQAEDEFGSEKAGMIADLEASAQAGLATLLKEGASKDLWDVYHKVLESSKDENLPQEIRTYLETRRQEIWDVLQGLEKDFEDYNILDFWTNLETQMLQNDKNITGEQWKEFFNKKLESLRQQLRDGKISVEEFHKEWEDTINAGYYDYDLGKMVPVFSFDERQDLSSFNELQRQIEAMTDEVNKLQSIKQTLADAVEELNDQQGISIDTFGELMQIGPQYLNLLFDENGQIDLNTEAIDKMTKARLRDLAVMKAIQTVDLIKKYQDEGKSIDDILKTKITSTKDATEYVIQYARETIKSGMTDEQWQSTKGLLTGIVGSSDKVIINPEVEVPEKSIEKIKELKSSYEDLINVQQTLAKAYQEYSSGLGLSMETFSALMELHPKYLAMLFDENGQITLNTDSINEMTKAYRKQMAMQKAQEIINLAVQLKNNAEDGKVAWDELENAVGGSEMTWDDIRKKIKDLGLPPELKEQVEQYIDNLEKLGNTAGDIAEGFDEHGKTVSNYIAELDNLQSVFSSLKDIIEEYNKNGAISVDNFEKILQLNPAYLKFLIDEEGQLQLNEEAFYQAAEAAIRFAATQRIVDALDHLISLGDAADEFLKYGLSVDGASKSLDGFVDALLQTEKYKGKLTDSQIELFKQNIANPIIQLAEGAISGVRTGGFDNTFDDRTETKKTDAKEARERERRILKKKYEAGEITAETYYDELSKITMRDAGTEILTNEEASEESKEDALFLAEVQRKKLREDLEKGLIDYATYKEKIEEIANRGTYDYELGRILPIYSIEEREEIDQELKNDDVKAQADYIANEVEKERLDGLEGAMQTLTLSKTIGIDKDVAYELKDESISMAFGSINKIIEEGGESYSESLKKLRDIVYDDTLTEEQRKNAIDQLRKSVESSVDKFIENIEHQPWRLSVAWNGTIDEFEKIIKEGTGIDFSSLTREEFLSLDIDSEDKDIAVNSIKSFLSFQEEQLNNGTINWETFWKNRQETVGKYGAALTEGEKQMYLNEEKAAEDFANNLKTRYNNGELTAKQYVERIKSITGVDDYFKKNEIFAVLNSEIDEFYKRLEDGSITTLSDYMSNVKQELLDAGLWATEWGNEIWNEALTKGASYTSSKYKAEYDNLMTQQTLADWGMTNDYNVGNIAEYKMPYAQNWYEQEKANLDYYIANWKGIGSILEDEGYQAQMTSLQTAKDNLKKLADEHLQFSLNWISHEESMNRLTYAEKVDAYDRILDRIESGYYRQMFANEEEYINWQKEQVANLRQSKIDAARAEAQQYANILKEKLEDEKAYYEKLKSIREKEFDASQTIRESQHELNMELQKSLTMYEYLDEETRKLIFNEEDYVALTKELSGIQTEINDLTSTYESKIASATTEEAELLTAEYEAQIELKLKEFEIAKANLEITKKQMALQNTLNERNTRMFINGQWTWVANQEEVAKAREELAEAEFNAETAALEYQHEQAMNQLDSAINDIQRDINEINQALEDLEKTLSGEDGLIATFEKLKEAVSTAKTAYNNKDDILDENWHQYDNYAQSSKNVIGEINDRNTLSKNGEEVEDYTFYVGRTDPDGNLEYETHLMSFDGDKRYLDGTEVTDDFLKAFYEAYSTNGMYMTDKTSLDTAQTYALDDQYYKYDKESEKYVNTKDTTDTKTESEMISGGASVLTAAQEGNRIAEENKESNVTTNQKIDSDLTEKSELEINTLLAHLLSQGYSGDEDAGILVSLAESLVIETFFDKLDKIWNKLDDIEDATRNVSSAIKNITFNARGNVINRPTLSWIGEDGPEAIIPLSPKYRDRGLSLWEEATKALGIAPSFRMPTIRASFPQQKENMNVSQTINVTVQNEDSSNDFYAITNLL